MSGLKLKVDLIPQTSWGNNLRNKLSPEQWDGVRKSIYAKAGNSCELCGAKGRLECDEVWEFDNETDTQKLASMSALCKKCHNVKHLGRIHAEMAKGSIPVEYVVELEDHFCNVNNTTKEVLRDHVIDVNTLFEERSKKRWKIDFGEYDSLTE